MRKLIESVHVALGGQIDPQLSLADVRRFTSGVLVLIYTSKLRVP